VHGAVRGSCGSEQIDESLSRLRASSHTNLRPVPGAGRANWFEGWVYWETSAISSGRVGPCARPAVARIRNPKRRSRLTGRARLTPRAMAGRPTPTRPLRVRSSGSPGAKSPRVDLIPVQKRSRITFEECGCVSMPRTGSFEEFDLSLPRLVFFPGTRTDDARVSVQVAAQERPGVLRPPGCPVGAGASRKPPLCRVAMRVATSSRHEPGAPGERFSIVSGWGVPCPCTWTFTGR